MDIRDLEYLAAAAESENFGRSAQTLGVNVSTISRRICRIEDELGLALFERRHAGVRLTAGGRAVMAHVRGALAEVEAVKRAGLQIGSGLSGEVRLGSPAPELNEAASPEAAEVAGLAVQPHRPRSRSRPGAPISSNNADFLLVRAAKPQLGRSE